MATTLEQNFRIVVEKIFNNWPDLRLAVEHGMGGRTGHKTAIEIMNYTYDYCVRNENITQGELQDVMEDLMDEEFNTICDDNSIPEICRHLLKYLRMCREGRYAEIEAEFSQLPQTKEWLRPEVKINYTPIKGEDSSSSSEADDDTTSDSDMDVDMGEGSGAGTSRKQKDDFVEPDPEWTTVRTRRQK